jgi:hypothetical protein
MTAAPMPGYIPRDMNAWTPKMTHIARRALRAELRELQSLGELTYDDSACDAVIEGLWKAICEATK